MIAMLALFGLLALSLSSLGNGKQSAFGARTLLNKKLGVLDNIKLDQEEIDDMLSEIEKAFEDGASAAKKESDESSRRSSESSYSKSDQSSWGGQDAIKHARRVPVFAMAQEVGEDDIVDDMKDAIDDAENDCDSDDEEVCEHAVRCVALHTITSHWEKLHLLEGPCNDVIKQMEGGKKKHGFNPEDRGAMEKAIENAEEVLEELGKQNLLHRLACDKDRKCNQKMSCYLSLGLAEEYSDYVKIVRCPYGGFKASSSSIPDDDDE